MVSAVSQKKLLLFALGAIRGCAAGGSSVQHGAWQEQNFPTSSHSHGRCFCLATLRCYPRKKNLLLFRPASASSSSAPPTTMRSCVADLCVSQRRCCWTAICLPWTRVSRVPRHLALRLPCAPGRSTASTAASSTRGRNCAEPVDTLHMRCTSDNN